MAGQTFRQQIGTDDVCFFGEPKFVSPDDPRVNFEFGPEVRQWREKQRTDARARRARHAKTPDGKKATAKRKAAYRAKLKAECPEITRSKNARRGRATGLTILKKFANKPILCPRACFDIL
jgi:hypothetical protein